MMQLAWRDKIDRILSETPSIHGRAGQALVAAAGYEPLFEGEVVRASSLQSGDGGGRFRALRVPAGIPEVSQSLHLRNPSSLRDAETEIADNCRRDARTTQDGRLEARTTSFDASIGGGLPRGAVTEILSEHASTADPCGQSGALAILMPMLRRLTRDGRTVALVDHGAGMYPPGLAAAGVDLANVLLLRPKRRHDALWAAEECARSREIAATVLPMSRLRDLDVRRLSLAAEEGQGVMVILRPGRESGEVASGGLRLWVGAGGPSAESHLRALRVPAEKHGAPKASPHAFQQPQGYGDGRLQERGAAPVPQRLQAGMPAPQSPALRMSLEVLRRRGAMVPPPVNVEVKHGSSLHVSVDAPSHVRPHRARAAAASA